MQGSEPVTSPLWPPVTYEQHRWVMHADAPVSRRQRARHEGPYAAAVTAPIADVDVVLPAGLLAECEDAATEMARFDAEATAVLGTGELAPLPSVLLRSESAASSQIENLTVGARQLAMAELGAPASRNAETVAGNVAAMRAALDLAGGIDVPAILSMHRALMGPRDASSGVLRAEQVWIGGESAGPHRAMFVPPHHTRVPAAMDDLVTFIARTDLPVLAHAALAHAQFETIHPFTDGNGRTGRALIHAMVHRARLTRRMTVPLSAGLLANIDAYFDALGAFRLGQPEPLVARLNEAVMLAVANARRLLADLVDIRQAWTTTVRARSDATVWRAIDVVIAQPVIDMTHLAARLEVSATSAQSAIDALVRAGALRPSAADRRRYRVWQADDVLGALDEFAARAGRRQLPG